MCGLLLHHVARYGKTVVLTSQNESRFEQSNFSLKIDHAKATA